MVVANRINLVTTDMDMCLDCGLAQECSLILMTVAGEGGVVVATDLLMILSRESGALLLNGSSILATMAFCRSLLSITVVWGTTL